MSSLTLGQDGDDAPRVQRETVFDVQDVAVHYGSNTAVSGSGWRSTAIS
jgi:hypothetical protein